MSIVANKNQPLLQMYIIGKGELTDKNEEFNFSVKEKRVYTETIIDTDPEGIESLASLDKANLLIVTSDAVGDDPLILKLTVDDTINPAYDIELPVHRLLVYEIGDELANWITQLKYSTVSTTAIQFEATLIAYKTA